MKMGTKMNVQDHNLRRVISPVTPREAREDKISQPPSYYACTCGTPIIGATSRRQARKLHKKHRIEVLANRSKVVPVTFAGKQVGTAYMDEAGAIHSHITDVQVASVLADKPARDSHGRFLKRKTP